MLPCVGFEMLASSFSSVLLPAPLWPMMPTTSPCSTLEAYVVERLERGAFLGGLPGEAPELIEDRGLRLVQLAELELLRDVVDFDDGHDHTTSAKCDSARLK